MLGQPPLHPSVRRVRLGGKTRLVSTDLLPVLHPGRFERFVGGAIVTTACPVAMSLVMMPSPLVSDSRAQYPLEPSSGPAER
jgi:hypothetical protein